MIITEAKTYEDILKSIDKSKELCIVSCNSCAKICKTGGKEKLEALESKLKSDGFNVAQSSLIGVACNFEQIKKTELSGNSILALVCEAGVYNLRKITDKEIIPVLRTIGVGTTDEQGNVILVKKF